mmetsp:Transcript_21596/g.49090  ORF Transcript_21596/g.49090 Transcript_21596/m.49090 type:complete len:147 (-) Transcript_21596:624-1064(-)
MFSIWIPQIKLSIDGEPLAVSASELFVNFPYERLSDDSPTISFFLKPFTPIILIIAYFLSEKIVLPKICQSMGIDGKSNYWKILFVLHNFLLALFSLVVMLNSWPTVIQHLSQYGLHATFCDQDGRLWASGIGAWATIFYVSFSQI